MYAQLLPLMSQKQHDPDLSHELQKRIFLETIEMHFDQPIFHRKAKGDFQPDQ